MREPRRDEQKEDTAHHTGLSIVFRHVERAISPSYRVEVPVIVRPVYLPWFQLHCLLFTDKGVCGQQSEVRKLSRNTLILA